MEEVNWELFRAASDMTSRHDKPDHVGGPVLTLRYQKQVIKNYRLLQQAAKAIEAGWNGNEPGQLPTGG
ncbi:hypothetical protein C8244_13815 [Paracidovorax avenae]|uniref:hypothetical protein n=1 Tax=Paracidovorax avenae TaxID=80867 RepID=UPI000D168E4D|nr:hypothetical protein [Paracidovorax avenae]AVS82007.1 hypothetical protein C8237_13520 [Paracidovorax avenae]AVT17173.1 hypothetical protein C8244_13815 [Paracidovorax avenae]